MAVPKLPLSIDVHEKGDVAVSKPKMTEDTVDRLNRLRLMAGAARLVAEHGEQECNVKDGQLMAYVRNLLEFIEGELRSMLDED